MSVFLPTAEQDQLRAAVRRLLEEQSTSEAVRRWMDTEDGLDLALWQQFASLGLAGLAVPGQDGSEGSTLIDLAIVSEELGATLACVPFFASTVLAAQSLALAGQGEWTRWLEPITSGGTLATLATVSTEGDWSPAATGVSARRAGGRWYLDGAKSYVVDGTTAQLILVTANTGGTVSLFAVEATALALARQSLPTLDLTRRLAMIEFRSTPAEIVGEVGAAESILVSVLDVARIALAAEQLGVARRCLEMSVGYAKIRYQFGRPIGSFQAIKHKCADMLVAAESARSATYYAAQCAVEGTDDAPAAATIAKIVSCDAAFRNAAENIQIHGGIGFTWEHDAHLYFKRSKSAQLYLGDSILQHRRLADLVGIS
jgi:alkylation response protein AidB-like acyl-CoA dehydrogenase